MVFKFHDDPTVRKSRIVILLRQIWVYVKKREGFEERKKGKESVKTYRQSKK